ncbi:alpha-L-glycero-D-manno-heptose beta-1,4-glucosyltransferase [Piscirickettsia salmonis]|nr:alpha-L-glycero-D-manno-heptose beta-1,4-glucosyltransferase [Piscirickettsia salmonis LF-89 = ATCC VR-1361]ALY04273.1 alpha-L-glycero-D-manno-heptose beta-1,4-glucosyltransferase [Piscirickettsia salmonis]AMA43830.1 alpha-L-glycero-D-manno-heptose beta-1,4-glucosyltransferase [Piscirickettsia salmonis]AOS36755.1 alpha-L-glycero-D-manno-heptose beta-1,4-glucosyltransferase [Piscirickettsia salmonis]APS61922.1 alpha-L-glycero-D-manno-heptose beta-1,4-glucosyltransferase [Piscirickettsia salmo
MVKVSAYVIAYNEEEKIRDCVQTLLWADEIIVADSGSTDRTAVWAEELGANVVQVPFNGFGDLRNQAIAHCTGDWIFSLDADERCTSAVRDEILEIIRRPESERADIYQVPRRNFFLGRWIKHAGWYPNYRQPQLFRRGSMSYDLKPVHEGYIAHSHKPIGELTSAIWQIPFKNLDEVMHKANRYSTLGVDKLVERGKQGSFAKALLHGFWSFFKHYLLKRGFLDGWPGFIIALGNFEGTFYRHAKLTERQASWSLPKSEQVLKKD